MLIEISRRSGPCTDKAGQIEVGEHEKELVQAVLNAVNVASSNKEGWHFDEVEEELPCTCHPLPRGSSSKCRLHGF